MPVCFLCIHGIIVVLKSSTRRVQQTILSVLHKLNREICSLRAVAPDLLQKSEVSFELGVAEAFDFNFFDEKELDRFRRSIVENPHIQ